MWNMMKEEADQSQWPCGKVQGNANSFCYADSLGMLSQNQTIFFLHLRRGGVLSPPDLGSQGQQFSKDRKTAKCRLKSRMLPLFFSEIPTPEKPNGNSVLPAMKIEHLAKA